jgi:hypothetical protein
MSFLKNCLAASITLLALSHSLRAQEITIVPCGGSVDETYCYDNNADQSWHWHCECPVDVINLIFTSGSVEEGQYDQLMVFDGPDDGSPLLYQNYPGTEYQELAGLQLISSGTDLYMTFNSNATTCCATGGLLGGGLSEWVWTASSGTVGIHEEQAGNFTIYPNPATSEIHIRLATSANGPAEVRILDVTGRVVYQNSFTANGSELATFDLHGLQSGNYSVMLATSNRVRTQKLQVIR